MAVKYNRAPLVEAVVEFRLRNPVSQKDFEKLRKRFSPKAWKAEDLVEVEVKMAGGPGAVKQTLLGHKLTSLDATEAIQLQFGLIAMSRFAPYPGWETFEAQIRERYGIWRSVVGPRPISRLGIRYVNRLDIPFAAADEAIPFSDYLTFTSVEPDFLDAPARAYSVAVHSGILKDQLDVNLSSALVASPLINHFGLTLDIDVFRELPDAPQDEETIWELVDLIRRRRTEIFERCITDKCRALIS